MLKKTKEIILFFIFLSLTILSIVGVIVNAATGLTNLTLLWLFNVMLFGVYTGVGYVNIKELKQ